MNRRVLLPSVAALLMLPYALGFAGTWLVLDEPLEPASAIVVFGGDAPRRATEAASLFHGGLAREVWLTQTATAPEFRGGVPEYHHSLQILDRASVPAEAIRVLQEPTENTAAEVRSVIRQLQSLGGGRVILVTSEYHARRVRVLWDAFDSREYRAIVRTAGETSPPWQWWRTPRGVKAVSREWAGLLIAWTQAPWQ